MSITLNDEQLRRLRGLLIEFRAVCQARVEDSEREIEALNRQLVEQGYDPDMEPAD